MKFYDFATHFNSINTCEQRGAKAVTADFKPGITWSGDGAKIQIRGRQLEPLSNRESVTRIGDSS